MSKPAIICVDDEPIVLESLKIELKQALGDSCLIETAESGEEALELFEELQTDSYEVAVVLADQSMPGLRGDELLSQIHQLSPQTLNIMITGHADLDTLSTLIRKANLYRHIAKPWQSGDLRSTILEAIQSYRRIRELELQNTQLQQQVQQLEQAVEILQESRGQIWQEAQQQESLNRVYLAFAIQQFQLCESVQARVDSLDQLNQLKDQFLSSVSRELRAPISNVRMAAQMLEVRLQQLGIDETELQCEKYFQILRTECQRQTDLLNDLLTLTRLDSDTEPLNLSTVNLNLWIPHIIEPFTDRTADSKQQFTIQVPPTLPPMMTDLIHLERTLTELLQNAWKYTPSGESITLEIEVIHPPDLQEDSASELPDLERPLEATIPSMSSGRFIPEILIRVTNSGIEIPPEEYERIFTQFYRIPNNNFWNQGGTGLGLAIVKKRVEKLRGTIEVESGQGQTMFTVRLPLSAIDR